MSKIDAAKIKISGFKPQGNTAVQVVEDNQLLKSRYYDIDTGKPLSLAEIEGRITRNFNRIEKSSIESILDIYFIHKNWKDYKNEAGVESFQEYLREKISLSRSYAYDIIKAVDMLIEHSPSDSEDLFMTVAEPIERIGMSRLKLVSQVKDDTRKHEILSDLLAGKEITTDEILTENRAATQAEEPKVAELVENTKIEPQEEIEDEETESQDESEINAESEPEADEETKDAPEIEKPTFREENYTNINCDRGWLSKNGQIVIDNNRIAFLYCSSDRDRIKIFELIYEYMTREEKL
jgi:hypothetical protein